jgi:hypothetical protein
VHSLSTANMVIQSKRGSEETNNDDDSIQIQTKLPELIVASLEIDPPIELLYLDGDNKKESKGGKPYRFCLYTRKSLFVLQISTGSASNTLNGICIGEVVSLSEPLERYLDVSMQTSVVRVRPAPSHALLAPTGCFAVLTENTEICEYSILLHNSNGIVSAPLYFGIENVVANSECFVDFCFANSSGLGLLASMTVLLLKESGDVLAASPVVFDGAVTAMALVKESVGHLEMQMEKHDRSTAKWRQCRAAFQYIVDVFCHGDHNRGNFRTANVLNQKEKSAAKWPIKLQGPLLFHSHLDPRPPSVTIEPFGSTDCLAGIAIGKEAYYVDFVAISSSALLPRFVFESANDSHDIDDTLFKLSSVVERICLSEDGDSTNAVRIQFWILCCIT